MFPEYFNELSDDVILFGIFAAILLIVTTTVIIFVIRRKKILRKAVLITGLSESGKTLLFSKLVSSKSVTTYTSMKENSAMITTLNQNLDNRNEQLSIDRNEMENQSKSVAMRLIIAKKTLRLVDVPGNERLRSKFLDEFLPLSRGIVFVVDSLNISKEIRDVASFLYALLQDCLISKSGIPFLIVCNKQDQAVAKSSKVIQSQLEKEVNTLRVTQTAMLDSTSQNSQNVFLGRRDKDFQFSDLKPINIEFLECSALEPGEGDKFEILKSIWTWLTKIA